MIQNKQENRLGGSVAAIAVVALMVLCPLAMSDFSDANEIRMTSRLCPELSSYRLYWMLMVPTT